MFKKPMVMFSADLGGGQGGSGEPEPTNTNTDPKPAGGNDSPMIPKDRFDQVNNEAKLLREKVEAFEQAQAEAERQREADELQAKQAQGKFEELYNATQKELEQYKAYESRSKELEEMIQGMVDTKLKAVPEDMVDLVPSNLSVEQTLDWLNKAESKGLFAPTKQEAKEVGKPSNKSNEAPKVDEKKLSPLDKIMKGLGS